MVDFDLTLMGVGGWAGGASSFWSVSKNQCFLCFSFRTAVVSLAICDFKQRIFPFPRNHVGAQTESR